MDELNIKEILIYEKSKNIVIYFNQYFNLNEIEIIIKSFKKKGNLEFHHNFLGKGREINNEDGIDSVSFSKINDFEKLVKYLKSIYLNTKFCFLTD